MAATRSLISSAVFALMLYAFGFGQALATTYTIQELLPLPGFDIAHAYSVNDSGQVVGYSYLPATLLPGTFIVIEAAQIAPMFWYDGAATALAAPSGRTVFIASDINDSGQIVGQAHACDINCNQPNADTGFMSNFHGSGGWVTVAPGSLASLPIGDPQCYQDDFITRISDTGYMVSYSGGISSPNMSSDLCGLNVSALYESGLMLTDKGYVYDPLVDSNHQWVIVPSCTGDVRGYVLSGSSFGFSPPVMKAEVSAQIAHSICDLVADEIHDKVTNASGQFIVNDGDKAFLYTPCSEFPGGGSTGGCFPGPGTFPAPAPATLALVAIGLAGLGCSRRRNAARRRRSG